jgi:hypothetical protein
MDYKIINDIVRIPRPSEQGEIFSVMLSKEEVDNITVICDYNIKGDSTQVTIKVRKGHDIIEERIFPNTNIFPKHIMRTRTHIIIYLESFRNEN